MRLNTLQASRAGILGLFLGALAIQPIQVQGQQAAATWDWARPDANAPAGVDYDRVVPKGMVDVFHRFAHTRFQGTRNETIKIEDTNFLLGVFPNVPLTTLRSHYQIGATAGVTDRIALSAELSYVLSQTTQTTVIESYGTESSGISDVTVGALFRFLERDAYRSHFSLGVSIPVGTIDAVSTTPQSFGTEVVLPYPQQIGSGTIDIRPGATFESQNEHGTFGAQVWGVSRLGENSRQYRLGDRFGGTTWFAPRFSDHLSGSIRFQWETWGDIQGFDSDLDAGSDQQAHPLNKGGNRLDVPVGLNFYPANGSLAGIRIGAEFIFPVRHNLAGPQLGMDWGFRFRLSREF